LFKQQTAQKLRCAK